MSDNNKFPPLPGVEVLFKGMVWQAVDAKNARNAELQKQNPPIQNIVIPRIS